MNNANYISEEGLQKIKEELEYRKTVLRKQISGEIAVAKEQGDLSENFEYQDAKERQGTNEVRISQLEQEIFNSVVVETKSGETDVSLGASFKVELEDGTTKTFEIVGSTEADPMQGKISNESPIGNAFLGKQVGDVVEVKVPSGDKHYKILSIE
ncbi:MAG: transcription elongation factor GreA [Patescibacteria group bacterium]|nr:transcription elongation factor GreA [Patescibacteria group bacterium]